MSDVTVLEDIARYVYIIRDKQVMLDHDLADIYGYEVKTLNQQVKRNIRRFPADFMFQLTEEEIPESLKSQFVTLNESGNKRGLHIKKMPYAFTEQGVYMLATVLRGELAEQQSIFIMRAFREMKHYIKQNQQFVTKNELRLLTDSLEISNRNIISKQNETEIQISEIKKSIAKINKRFTSDAELKNYVIYKGQKFEADKAYIDIYQRATKSIYIIDNYVNIKTLNLLSQKKKGVLVILFTENGHGREGFLTASETDDFNAEYPTLRIKPNPDCHDRFIIIDYGTKKEKVLHCGASSKDAGKKVCAINMIENTVLIHPIIENLLKNPDKRI